MYFRCPGQFSAVFFQDKGANSQVSGYFPGFNIPCARCMVYLPPIG